MDDIGYPELNALCAEFLPPRTMLSLITIDNSSTTYQYHFPEGGGDGNSQVAFACQSERVHGTPGLIGSLGLGSNNPSSSLTCVPAAVTSG
ncbi:hypothetical protein ACH46N_22280 [Streptomyces pristinaespiralis]|jgi:hypothetical protein|uniref:Uncharacterized protein n=2 Tax=Streptomyces pristinaespiralis TaxID=38300 RepID=B5HIH4_STRE2|nr:hypothetical protein [Streptomyces pristinaespiralis]ALC18426.1 hypothetical protein SPRI_0120 [Streptomyces pristinaespiralis]ALC25539.1 hypothetical protein SPRI_7233 [Streptomyces pristinaespiralis]EDY66635.1 conserved hypothetical protein [Streptomyces pristinaespiralis ATCC 25486]QMU12269.1 hypothetical protein H3L99_00580 [Streptomyces pristinaespiralis]